MLLTSSYIVWAGMLITCGALYHLNHHLGFANRRQQHDLFHIRICHMVNILKCLHAYSDCGTRVARVNRTSRVTSPTVVSDHCLDFQL